MFANIGLNVSTERRIKPLALSTFLQSLVINGLSFLISLESHARVETLLLMLLGSCFMHDSGRVIGLNMNVKGRFVRISVRLKFSLVIKM